MTTTRPFLAAIAGALALALLSPVIGAQIGVPPASVYVTAADTLKISAKSNWQFAGYANTANASPLLTNILSGNGGVTAGMTITGTNIPANTTVSQSSAAGQEIPTTGNLHTTTTVDGIPTADCAHLSAWMAVNGTGIPANDYLTAVSCPSVTLAVAATATSTGVALTFDPALVMSANATGTLVEGAITINANAVVLTVACDIVKAGSLAPVAMTPFTLTPSTSAAATASTASQTLPEGWLRNCVVTTSGSPAKGSTWLKLELVRAGVVQKLLTQGLVAKDVPVTFPPSGPLDPVWAACRTRQNSFPKPAAGQPVRITVPVGESWELLHAQELYTASTTLQDRAVTLTIYSGTGLPTWSTQVGGPYGGVYFPAGFTTLLEFSQDTSLGIPNIGTLMPIMTQLPRHLRVDGSGGQGMFYLIGSGFTNGQLVAMPVGDQLTEFQGLFNVCLADY